MFEAIVRRLLPLMPQPHTLEDSNAQPSSILVIEYWSMGDLAIIVPFLRNLRRSFPWARISLLVNTHFKSFLEGQGVVDEFIPIYVPWANHSNRWRKYNPFSRQWISLICTLLGLRKRRFDLAFSGRMDARDNFMLWLGGARRRIAYGSGGGGSFLTDRVIPDLSRPHRVDLWLHLLEAVGEPPDSSLGGLRLTEAELAFARAFRARLGIPSSALLVGVHPGARVATRRWGNDRFAEVVRQILTETDTHVLWFMEPGNSCEAPPLDRCHPVSLELRSFLAVLSRCQLLVCNDSGPMHLASLLDVPVVAIFGPQRPEWFGPRGRQDRVVIRPEFSCRPCFDYCIFDQPYCLLAISAEEVWSAVKSALQLVTRGQARESASTDRWQRRYA
jgi:heptosyltransferase-2